MRFDYITMKEALGRDPSSLDGFELRQIAPDEAVYPQWRVGGRTADGSRSSYLRA